MRAILLVDHGSRREEANAQLEELARRVAEREPGVVVRAAHMELGSPDIAGGIDSCIAAGADEIDVHPFFLTQGRHTREDVPRIVREAAARHPDVRVRLSEPLGLHEKIVDVVLERIAQSEPLD